MGPDVRPRREALEMLHDLRAGRDGGADRDDCRRHKDIAQLRFHRPDDEDIHAPNLLGQNKRPKVMPDQFDGKSSWADCIAHFEICCEINGWNLQQ